MTFILILRNLERKIKNYKIYKNKIKFLWNKIYKN